jgi:DNA-binding protein H-NS
MNKTLTAEPTADETAEMIAAIQEAIAEIDRLREQMRADNVAILESRARTRAILAELQGP